MSPQPLDYAPPPPGTILSRSASRWLRKGLPYIAVVMVCYTGTYVGLSTFGQFQPDFLSTGRIMSYRWVPAGFHDGFRQRWNLYNIYAPLYVIDRDYWHRRDYACTGKYPTTAPSNATEWADWDR